MYSTQHKFIFNHIPKNGGTTIEKYLFEYSDIVFPNYKNKNEDKVRKALRESDFEVTSKQLRTRRLFECFEKNPDFYKFAFVRNPWDRMVSTWNFFSQKLKTEKDKNFEQFVRKSANFLKQKPQVFFNQNYFESVLKNEDGSTYIRFNLAMNYLVSEGMLKLPFNQINTAYHILPQSFFLRTPMDFIGRFENFEEDFKKIITHLNLPEKPIEHIYKTEHKHYSEYYNDETKRIVSEIYKNDIETFNYSF